MNKRLIGAAAAAALAVVGTFAILLYVRDADDRAKADIELVEVYVIETSVRAGTGDGDLIDSIGTAEVQASTVVDGVITDLNQLNGQVAAVDLVPGEQVLLSRFIDAASYDDGRNRLTAVPPDLHEVTVSLDPERLVGGQVVPGDTVGVLASFGASEIGGVALDNIDTIEEYQLAVEAVEALPEEITNVETTHFVLNKVLVTRVQVEQLPVERTDADGNPIDTGILAPTGNLLVTVAVDALDAQRLIFSIEFGRVWMTYQPLTTADHDDDLEATHRGNVFDHPHDDGFNPFDGDATVSIEPEEEPVDGEAAS